MYSGTGGGDGGPGQALQDRRKPGGQAAAGLPLLGPDRGADQAGRQAGRAGGRATGFSRRFLALAGSTRDFPYPAEPPAVEIETLDFDLRAAAAYGRVRARLEARGTPIGPNDMLIAAHALSRGLTLVTDNTAEFSRVRGLKVESWRE